MTAALPNPFAGLPTEDTPAPDPAAAEARERIMAAIATVIDPEIGANIVDLGLIYDLRLTGQEAGWHVEIDMTLTTPACPVAGSMPGDVETTVAQLPDVAQAKVTLVWTPPWNPDLIDEAVRLQLGLL